VSIHNIHYTCGDSAINEFITYCQGAGYDRFNLVCDTRTYKVLGEQVEKRLADREWKVNLIEVPGEEVVVDQATLAWVHERTRPLPYISLAVGSGSLTDITRWVSHKLDAVFISLPTAPSVDGFASVVAPVVINGFKDTFPSQAPIAIFADLPTLCASPKAMIAAGFGDMLGKYTSLADWKLDHLLWDTPYNPAIAARVEGALQNCVKNLEGIQRGDPEGIHSLMDSLVESGLCMLEQGNSRPASGAEHHLSHFWEMRLLQLGKPAVFHGAKVGVGTVLVSGLWEQVRQLTKADVRRRLSAARLPDAAGESARIKQVFHPNEAKLIQLQNRFLALDVSAFDRLKKKIAWRWGEIQKIAATIPSQSFVVELLNKLSAPTSVTDVTLGKLDQADALQYAHYMRDQFTVMKLGRILGLWE
jgi:glycerol-1-phosphate dehydrogenase [NAD(P)+]